MVTHLSSHRETFLITSRLLYIGILGQKLSHRDKKVEKSEHSLGHVFSRKLPWRFLGWIIWDQKIRSAGHVIEKSCEQSWKLII